MRGNFSRGILILAIIFSFLTGIEERTALVQAAQAQENQDVEYVCPPCGIHCDRLHHGEAGQCPICGMTLIDKRDLVQAAIFLYPRVPISEVAGPAQVLFAGQGFFTYTVASSRDALFSQELFEIKPRHSVEDGPLPEVLIIGGGDMAIIDDAPAMEWLRKAAENAQVVLGVGRGVAVLAKAGLLKDKEAVLEERYSRLLQYFKLEEAAQYRSDRPWIQSGKFLTAVSADAAMDASLIAVQELLGRSQARQAAQRLGRTVPETQE